MDRSPPHPTAPTGNVALLIDADNASHASLDYVLTVLAELGTVNVRRIYGNWRKPALKGWADLTLRYGIEPFQQFDVTKGKNATDMKMTIDAMDLLFRGRITGFGIMSSDSDFMPLAQRIRQEGVPVYGFGTDRTPEGFRESCSRFIDVSRARELQGEAEPELILPPAIGRTRAAPKAAAAPAKPVPAEAAAANQKRKVDTALVKLLVDAYAQSRQDPQKFASLSEVGQRAGNRSSFDTRNYGFARLSDLIEQVPNFQVERRDNGVFVKRIR
ncbi:NYN domain-containing protein [Sphingomonas sp. PL-96]|uniref:NYN domain-containing protein n=1 Tax=Sphingomonas sp. PL-96 TaxID=2887201 RepID=UPI001E2F7F09|nr:NYN domain-containing protein [Sphingomonas sp. PL-96]MCC2976767.1 NYN domain-containing protein [Sphingomonas sp. PL-96]